MQIGGKALEGSYYSNHYFYGDPAPTVLAITGGTINAQLAEFSGNATSSPQGRSVSGNRVGATKAANYPSC